MKILFTIFSILVIQSIAFGSSINESEVDLDNVINLLLNSDNIQTEDPDIEFKDEQPIFSDGIWKCGKCDDIDESKLIYTEVNEVDTNDVSDDRPIVVQVGLNLESMQCVTVTSSSGAAVRRENGVCAGDAVTLAVFNARHFLVHVYGA